MRMLVIGGTRFIGPFVVETLVRQNHTVAVFNRGKSPHPVPEGVTRFEGDRREPGQLAKVVTEFKPDVIIDMMLVFESDAEILAEAARGIVRRVVAISSCDVYRNYGGLIGKPEAEPDPTPLTESSPLRAQLYPYKTEPTEGREPVWQDKYDKIPIEEIVLNDPGFESVVLRLPMVYGPGDYQHRTWSYLERLKDGRKHLVMGEATAKMKDCRAYVGNVAHAIALSAVHPSAKNKVYNLSDQPCLDEASWARAVYQADGRPCEVHVVAEDKLPDSLKTTIDARYDLDTDSSAIKLDLGYFDAISFTEALRVTVAWERENPPETSEKADYAAEDEVLARLGLI